MRVLRHPRVILIAAVTAAIVASDLAASDVSHWWADHPMAAGVVSGVLLLGIGVWVVEAWIVERSRPVVRQAYRAFGAEMAGFERLMRWTVNGRSDGPGGLPAGTGVDADCLRQVLTALEHSGVPAQLRREEKLRELLSV